MIRRPPRSTPLYSSAASDVYKRQVFDFDAAGRVFGIEMLDVSRRTDNPREPVSYTHLRAHETGRNLVCRLLLEKKKKKKNTIKKTTTTTKAGETMGKD